MNAYAPTRRDGPETNETAQIWIKDHPSPSLMKTTRVDGVRFNVDAALLTWIGERKVPLRVALRLLREAFFQFFLQELLAGLGLADHLDRAVAEPACVTCVGSAPRRWRRRDSPRHRLDGVGTIREALKIGNETTRGTPQVTAR